MPGPDRGARFLQTALRALLLGVVMLVSGCVYISRHTLRGACLTDMGSPVRNFCVVASQVLWRGERPTAADAKWLLEQNVGTVISLQLDDRRAFEAVTPPANYVHSVSYFKVPGFNPFQILRPARLDEHLALFIAIVKASPKPVYVHCRAGVDRTGVLAAAYRVLIDGATPEEAIAEMARFRSPWQHFDAHYIKGLTPERRAKILQEATAWESRLSPTASIDCEHGRCTYVRPSHS
jgi:protein tyrosine/serine phosphatase